VSSPLPRKTRSAKGAADGDDWASLGLCTMRRLRIQGPPVIARPLFVLIDERPITTTRIHSQVSTVSNAAPCKGWWRRTRRLAKEGDRWFQLQTIRDRPRVEIERPASSLLRWPSCLSDFDLPGLHPLPRRRGDHEATTTKSEGSHNRAEVRKSHIIVIGAVSTSRPTVERIACQSRL
jgi:hypothetical protein